MSSELSKPYDVVSELRDGTQIIQPYQTLYLAMREADKAQRATEVVHVSVWYCFQLVHSWPETEDLSHLPEIDCSETVPGG